MQAASSFLSCCIDSVPFKFLGLPVGSNPRRCSTWKPVIENLQKMLSNWKGKHLSMGGRVVLLNVVLSSIPLYFLSFFKAPKKVLQEIVKIQRSFLWGGVEENKKICWLSWNNVCKTKEGGLGIKNVEEFNLALLSKWKWRIITEENAIWYELMKHRYGAPHIKILNTDFPMCGSKDSLWWRDLLLLETNLVNEHGWFTKNISFKLGKGNNILFWRDKWHGNYPFRELYPLLYSLSENQNGNVEDMGSWTNNRWTWNLCIKVSELSEEGRLQLTKLQNQLHEIMPNMLIRDEMIWMLDRVNGFTVKSCYKEINSTYNRTNMEGNLRKAIVGIWKTKVPSKIQVHGWRLLLGRLATRDELCKRGILNGAHNLVCPLCFQVAESGAHMGFSCTFSKEVWRKVGSWLGISMIINCVGE